MGVIFLAGAYGVGKSRVSEKLATAITFPIYSASKLIFEESGVSYKVDKEVEDINLNQRILIKNVRNKLEMQKRIILDGHFILLNSSGEVERIPESVYKELDLEAIILITAKPEIVVKRLYMRDCKEYNLDIVEKTIEAETSYATYISDLLKIPIYEYINNDTSIQIDGILEFTGRLSQ